jgi:GTP-binding protein HflX
VNETKTNSNAPKALLVGIQLPKISDLEMQGSLAELARLVTTLGYQVIGQTSQKRNSERGANVVGDGKLRELAEWTGGTGIITPTFIKKKHKAALKFDSESDSETASESDSESMDNDISEFETPDNYIENETEDLSDESVDYEKIIPKEKAQYIIFDCDLSPSQLRNLESATGVKVLDRTGVIIEIFSRHARTRAAKLQVEIARLTYVAPRLRETGASDDQQGGGGKGAGETSLELDKRKIRDRIKELKENLAAIAFEQDNRRSRREQEISVALVGYTNAGKSSLMRTLTGSEVLVANQLFATLDTTVRALHPESHPKILISDTVGFIKKLPHDLVASFKSTLDEALSASLLLYVVDASDPSFRSQLDVTKKVLAEVGATEVQSLLLLNKKDRLSSDELQALQIEFPEAILLSTKNPEDIKNLRLKLIGYFETDMIDQDLFVPYTVPGAIGEIRAKMRVLSENYDGQGSTLRVRSFTEQIEKIKRKYSI